MKSIRPITLLSSLLLLSVTLSSCVHDAPKVDSQIPNMQDSTAASEQIVPKNTQPATLPVKYQTASYVVNEQAKEDLTTADESKIKVGARITSTRGPQPLWDILKRLAALKRMNISWASDVDKNALVDVDINANDDFFEALDNLLRQVDYFHEMKGNTIIIKYKETRQFQIAMPFTKQTYTTSTGGNVLGNSETSNNVDGTIKLASEDNEFDIWENIRTNIESIMEIWSYRRERDMANEVAIDAGGGSAGARDFTTGTTTAATGTATENGADNSASVSGRSTNDAGGQGYYMIDKPVGLITVTAPRPVLEKIDSYITTLKKSLYKQISIEAKIIEVQMNDSSSIGINWSRVLNNFNLSGDVAFGNNGQIYPFTYSNDNVVGKNTYSDDGTSYFKTINPGQFISNIALDTVGFDIFLNALKTQGDTKILSNPKLSVMNGQPSLITVGRNVTYVDSIESDVDTDNGVITYTVETERILSGIGMALTATVLGDSEIIMNLVPITSVLEEPIEYLDVGENGASVGLPIIAVREISTTVKVKDGEMLVIGGLISDTESSSGEFAPLLGDIPILKYLFGYEEKEHIKRELIILLRPRII
ncbi:pilus (MSHA type) biogenesis protein MshL [Desulforhopalus sp. 52FAK]